jgi:hypothetical protein
MFLFCFHFISVRLAARPPFFAICQAFLSVLYRRKWKENGFTFMGKILSNRMAMPSNHFIKRMTHYDKKITDLYNTIDKSLVGNDAINDYGKRKRLFNMSTEKSPPLNGV